MKQKFQMRSIDALPDRLEGSALHSNVDFARAFFQVPIHTDDTNKTAFHIRTHKLGFTSMSFGLVNAPTELQWQANNDFQSLSMRDGELFPRMMCLFSVALCGNPCSI